jgi:hypothetical protein
MLVTTSTFMNRPTDVYLASPVRNGLELPPEDINKVLDAFSVGFVTYRRKFLTLADLYLVFHLRPGKLAMSISAAFLFALSQAFGAFCSEIYSSMKSSTVSY